MNLDIVVELPNRAVKQPSPAIVSGGDCGFCTFAGIFGMSVEEVYQHLGEKKPMGWYDQNKLIEKFSREGFCDWHVTDVPIWPCREPHLTWGATSVVQEDKWFAMAVMAMLGGFYGITSINLDGKGPMCETDHVVMICGARYRPERHKTIAATSFHREILVSCSARHPEGEWCDLNKFLTTRGGFNTVWVKPK